MPTQQEVLNQINSQIQANGNEEITGPILNQVLQLLVNWIASTINRDWLESVKSVITSPPISPAVGDRYLIGSGVLSGAFTDHRGKVAEWTGDAWQYTIPTDETTVRVEDTGQSLVHDGAFVSGEYHWQLDAILTGSKLWNDEGTAQDTNGQGEFASALQISTTPLPKSYPMVNINGQDWPVADGDISGVCYFSNDSGATAKSWTGENGDALEAGDQLFWNDGPAGISLQNGWRVSFTYLIPS